MILIQTNLNLVEELVNIFEKKGNKNINACVSEPAE